MRMHRDEATIVPERWIQFVDSGRIKSIRRIILNDTRIPVLEESADELLSDGWFVEAITYGDIHVK